MNRFVPVALAAATVFAAATAEAGVITAGTVYNNPAGNFSPGYVVQHLSDQTGLSAGYVDGVTDFATYTGSGVTHETDEGGGGVTWLSNGIPIFPFVLDFDLGASKSVMSLALWNGTVGNDAAVNRFRVFTSDDSAFGVATLVGGFGNPIGAAGPEPVTVFDLNDSVGRYVRIEIDSYHGNFCCVGIGEVAFDVTGAAAPAPASVALLGLGLVGLGVSRRRPG